MSPFLKVAGNKIVDETGVEVFLRGAALGGWMNMENFITGMPGCEHQHRAAMLHCLGKENYEYFFNKFLEYFFTESDAALFASLSLNCIRVPFNYRHFEDDMNPRILKPDGFNWLDRVVDICAAHNIYTILDLHALPGGQNPDWHSDNASNIAMFWEYKDFQDRAIWLWEEIAMRYKENPWVAGYNPLNEPADSEHSRLVEWYARVEKAIRRIDPDHILFFDGNTFAMDFRKFPAPLPNSVYSCHDYSWFGFPAGDRYQGTPEHKDKLLKQFHRKIEFMREHDVPIWNGEFGPVYSNLKESEDWETINEERANMVGHQLEIYSREHVSWSIWCYKDIGLQGMVYTSPESKWNKTLQPFLDKKQRTSADFWGSWPTNEIKKLFQPVVTWLEVNAPALKTKYPAPLWDVDHHLARLVRYMLLSEGLQPEFASYFKDMSLSELDDMAASFKLENCCMRENLNNVLRAHAEF